MPPTTRLKAKAKVDKTNKKKSRHALLNCPERKTRTAVIKRLAHSLFDKYTMCVANNKPFVLKHEFKLLQKSCDFLEYNTLRYHFQHIKSSLLKELVPKEPKVPETPLDLEDVSKATPNPNPTSVSIDTDPLSLNNSNLEVSKVTLNPDPNPVSIDMDNFSMTDSDLDVAKVTLNPDQNPVSIDMDAMKLSLPMANFLKRLLKRQSLNQMLLRKTSEKIWLMALTCE